MAKMDYCFVDEADLSLENPVSFNVAGHLNGLYHLRFAKKVYLFFATLPDPMRKTVGAAFNLKTYLDPFPTAYSLAEEFKSSHHITYSH